MLNTHNSADKLIVNAPLDKQSSSRYAVLTLVKEHATARLVDRKIREHGNKHITKHFNFVNEGAVHFSNIYESSNDEHDISLPIARV
jgi:hypothetical protein